MVAVIGSQRRLRPRPAQRPLWPSVLCKQEHNQASKKNRLAADRRIAPRPAKLWRAKAAGGTAIRGLPQYPSPFREMTPKQRGIIEPSQERKCYSLPANDGRSTREMNRAYIYDQKKWRKEAKVTSTEVTRVPEELRETCNARCAREPGIRGVVVMCSKPQIPFVMRNKPTKQLVSDLRRKDLVQNGKKAHRPGNVTISSPPCLSFR